MDPMTWAALIGAGAGIYKSQIDKQRADKDRMVQAETARWSPWTGMKPERAMNAQDMFSSGIEGGLTGLQFGKQFEGRNKNVDTVDGNEDDSTWARMRQESRQREAQNTDFQRMKDYNLGLSQNDSSPQYNLGLPDNYSSQASGPQYGLYNSPVQKRYALGLKTF